MIIYALVYLIEWVLVLLFVIHSRKGSAKSPKPTWSSGGFWL